MSVNNTGTLSSEQVSTAASNQTALIMLLKRLHFYIGLFVGPFILVAALTGTLYVITPQLEEQLYAHQLFTSSTGKALPLSQQITAALQAAGEGPQITAVRPAATTGENTWVMLAAPNLQPSEARVLFVDPATLEVRGDLIAYSSSMLPLRTWLSYLHRNLLLGDIGRYYNELAASWLWIAALGGILLWATGRTPNRKRARKLPPQAQQHLQTRRRHTTLGLCLLVGMLFFSATGLTWSQWAGNNISIMRAHFGWLTPRLVTNLQADQSPVTHQGHASHHGHHNDMPVVPPLRIEPEIFEQVLHAARMAGLTANSVEIRPGLSENNAWTVNEQQYSWPTRIDAVAVDPHTLSIVDHLYFDQFPLLAKLTRWGIDAHMGVLFGVPNQIILTLFGLGLCAMIGWGYKMWWTRRPKMAASPHPANTLYQAWRKLPLSLQLPLSLAVLLLAFCLPVMGVSLGIFVLVDIIRWKRATVLVQQRHTVEATTRH